MRKLLRIFRQFITALLLLIAILAIVVWPLSNSHGLALIELRPDRSLKVINESAFYSLGGRLEFMRARLIADDTDYDFSTQMTWSLKWSITHDRKWMIGRAATPSMPLTDRTFSKPIDWMSLSATRAAPMYRYQNVSVSLWLVSLIAAIWPATSFALWRRRRRIHRERNTQGHCPACGYDLRATPEKGGQLFDRCPECGVSNA